ncbi:hypothetical protein L6164_019304 [Bauhinia variegata]|uniref:Uncharacterized protein n=1 Tax=Bauhinia variegata TaxID=167791 RepID=A0ACB9MRF9_BAUVA|nr:hypothetical protein L6164_019304 [Bauhinia variegata]
MVQAFISCVTTGNVKVQWNVCHAFGNLFLNETLKLQCMDWAPFVFGILLQLLRDSSNYKIRIQAAAALAVPVSVLDYGLSFSDVVQGVEHAIENLGVDQISTASNFKYRVALQKQLTLTMLHVLSFSFGANHDSLKDFLVKKASFLKDWFKALCSPVQDAKWLGAEDKSFEDRMEVMGSGFRVQGSGVRVQGSGFRGEGSGFRGFWGLGVSGLGLRVEGFRLRVQGFRGSGFRVQGSGFRVQGSGFRVQGSGFRGEGSGFRGFWGLGVSGLGLRVEGFRLRVQGFRVWGFRVQGSGFRVQGSGFRVQGSGVRVQGSGVRVQGLGVRVSGFGFRVRV